MTRLLAALLLIVTVFFTGPVSALEQGPPVDGLSLPEIPFYTYNLHKKGAPEKFEVKLPVALETEGLFGPLPMDHAVAAHFWEKYKESGMKRAVDYSPSAADNYATPFIRLAAMQKTGTPVRLGLRAPEPSEIAMPLAGEGGQAGNIRYKAIKRNIDVRIIDGLGELVTDADRGQVNLVVDKEAMALNWTPAKAMGERKLEYTAPVVMEISLQYRIRREILSGDGLAIKGTEQEYWIERRVAWLALPVCGQPMGEDDAPIVCPLAMDPGPAWKPYTLGPVSFQVPEDWRARVKNDSGRFELGNALAGILVAREPGGEKQVTYLKEVKETAVTIDGLSATAYSGLADEGRIKGQVILFKDLPPDGKPLAMATTLKDERYAGILKAVLDSVVISKGEATAPGIPACPEAADLPLLAAVGSGAYQYQAGTPVPDAGTAPDQPAPQTEAPVQAQAGPAVPPPDSPVPTAVTQTEPVAPVPVPGVQPAAPAPEASAPATVTPPLSQASLRLKKLKGFSDFVGRNQSFVGDGSADTQLALEISAPDQTIIHLGLRPAGSGAFLWDTDLGSEAWLLVATKKNKPVNQADGSLALTLGPGAEKFSLWVQDNNTIAAGQQPLELEIRFDNNQTLIIPMER